MTTFHEETTYRRLPDGRLERVTKTPGLVVVETFQLQERTEERSDCYCCTCPETGFDAHCRNHGWNGARACATHGMAASR